MACHTDPNKCIKFSITIEYIEQDRAYTANPQQPNRTPV